MTRGRRVKFPRALGANLCPPSPTQRVVWRFPLATFLVGFRKDGVIVLTCIEDGDESEHVDEKVAWTFAEGYPPYREHD